jgi:small multidrug resistance family-3 protein
MIVFRTFGLFLLTAVAEIVGCYLPYLWLRRNGSAWLLLPGAASLALFAWLLTLHPTAAGRVYAAYGGAYVTVALLWLWRVDRVRSPDRVGSGRSGHRAPRNGRHRLGWLARLSRCLRLAGSASIAWPQPPAGTAMIVLFDVLMSVRLRRVDDRTPRVEGERGADEIPVGACREGRQRSTSSSALRVNAG